MLVKKYLEAATFNNITRLVFRKRFEDADGGMSEQGLEIKATLANRLKLSESESKVKWEQIRWLRWLFPLDSKAFAKHGARMDALTTQIMKEHSLTYQKSGETAKQNFIDALFNLQEEYELSDDTITTLLWVTSILPS